MRTRLLATAAFALAALTAGSAASAATLVLGTCTTTGVGTISCTQSGDTISYNETGATGTYNSTINFTNSLAGTYEVILESTTAGFNFTNVSVNGSTVFSGSGHIVDVAGIPLGLGPDNVTFTASVPTTGADTGSVSFTIASVPEPATWAMMLLGFGGIGVAMRRRRLPVLSQLA